MKILKPSWVHHDGHPIFSIDVHPDDTRFVTGGQGKDSCGRIVIWNMKPVLDIAKEQDNNISSSSSVVSGKEDDPAKILCQLDHHQACVNSVRWSHSGKYLASGGDDRIIIIWRLVSGGHSNASLFGKAGVESWRVVYSLRGHAGDILDINWSPDGKYLASASVDNSVIIWNALKFPMVVTELKGHTSLVKGVTWDPVAKYVATQSADKTLKIWRTTDWGLEHTVSDPFTECGGTTHVLRLDWSPDGLYMVSAHAMNGGGPTAQIIERDGWRTDKDFVGHRKAVTCVRFNPNIMTLGKTRCCCVALGSRDQSISVWSTNLKRPVVVVNDVFSNSVMDIGWSACGKVMVACSWDGSVAFALFSEEEIGKPMSREEKSSLQQRFFGKTTPAGAPAPKLIQNIEIFMKRKDGDEGVETGQQAVNHSSPPPAPKKPKFTSESELLELATTPVVRGPTDKQIETRTPEGRRRITPKFLLPNSEGSAMTAPASTTTTTTIFQNSEDSHHSNLRENMVSGIEEITRLGNHVEEQCKEPTAITASEGQGQEVKKEGEATTSTAKPEKSRAIPTAEAKDNVNEAKRKEGVASSAASTQKEKEPSPPKVNGEREIIGKKYPVPESTPAPAAATLRRKPSEDSNLAKPQKRGAKMVAVVESVPEVTSAQTPGPSRPPVLPPPILQPIPTPSSPPKSTPVAPIGQSAPPRRRLNPMRIDGVFCTTIQRKPDTNYTLEVENKVTAKSRSFNLRCNHLPSPTSESPLAGQFWTLQTEAGICGASGDGFRIVAACEDATIHVLDLKGRYAFPPLLVSSVPSKMSHCGAYLLVVTTKGTMHVWNIHAKKKVVVESVMPLVNQPGGEGKLVDIAQVAITPAGVPRIILTNGKSFMFHLELGSWMALSEPMVRARGGEHNLEFLEYDPLVRRTGIVSQVKLRLASATELERKGDVREWLILLAKSLASRGLRGELHQLCTDLMGPTHSGVGAKGSSWAKEVGGVDKREVLRVILNSLLEDLAWQDFYCEFQDMLEMEDEFGGMSGGVGVGSAARVNGEEQRLAVVSVKPTSPTPMEVEERRSNEVGAGGDFTPTESQTDPTVEKTEDLD